MLPGPYMYMMQHAVPGVPLYRGICSATWSMRRQFVLQQVPTLKDVLPIVLSDENDLKNKNILKNKNVSNLFLPSFKIILHFLVPRVQP